MAQERMSYADWQAYQKRQLAWLAGRIGQLQQQINGLQALYDAMNEVITPVSRETKEAIDRATQDEKLF